LQNEEAEELMRHVEQEEEEAARHEPEGLQLHLCIINLVIGTLYCSKVGGCICFSSPWYDYLG
jgi:tetratricopeptide repeat protein 30